MDQPYVITVILNTNRRQDTLECLATLQKNTYPNHTTLILDNASTDGSLEAIHARFPLVEIISLTENKGYAGNNNVGIHAALQRGADWVFVLNEDTLLDSACLDAMIEAGESDPRIGIIGPMVYHHNEPAVIQSAGGVFNNYLEATHIAQNEPDRGQFIQPRQVDWISGCAILVRRAVIEEVGALDERFFYYWEETEWCFRAGKRGWKVVHVPQAHLWHKGVQRDYRPGPSVTYYNTRNRFLMLAKHGAPLNTWFYTWAETLRRLVSWSIRPQWRHLHQHRDALWLGIVDFLRQRWGPMPARKVQGEN
jgi:GT2 family glycosyltransferase